MTMNINDFPIALARFDAQGNCIAANDKWPAGLNVHINEASHVGLRRMERICTHADGTTRRYDITVQHDEGWEVTACAQEMLYDTHEEKTAVSLQWDLEYQARLMLEAAPFSIALFDTDMRVIDCNTESMRLYGFENQYLNHDEIKNTLPDIQPDGRNSMEVLHECINLALKNGIATAELMQMKNTGEAFPAEITWVRTTYMGRDVVAEFLIDISEKRKAQQRARAAERKLHEQEAYDRLRIMIDAAPLIVEFWDSNHRIIDCNQRALDFYGFTNKADYMHETQLTMVDEQPDGTDSMQFRTDNLNKVFETGSMHVEYKEKKLNGEVIFIEVEGLRINVDGEDMAITYSKDVTPIKMAHEALLAASQAKGNFLSTISHEMRTPLNAIIGMSAIAYKEKDEEKRTASIGKVTKAGKHLLALINDVLDMAKIEADKLELLEADVDLHSLLHKVVILTEFPMAAKKHQFILHVAENVPPCYYGDDQRLTQVLINLLSNAINYTPKGGEISLTASITEETADDAVLQFVIADNGPGIAPENQPRLFEAFERAGATSPGGTGLGLPISKRLAMMMGGDIFVDSTVGEGSKFTVQVKLMRREAQPDTPHETADTFPAAFAGKRILLVEDVEINCEIVQAYLDGSGLIIDIAANGREAVDAVSQHPDKYDFIFMDVQMPIMNGLDATRHIRALPHERARTLPIVAMTANVFTDSINECRDAGMNGHVGKPLDVEAVVKALREYLH